MALIVKKPKCKLGKMERFSARTFHRRQNVFRNKQVQRSSVFQKIQVGKTCLERGGVWRDTDSRRQKKQRNIHMRIVSQRETEKDCAVVHLFCSSPFFQQVLTTWRIYLFGLKVPAKVSGGTNERFCVCVCNLKYIYTSLHTVHLKHNKVQFFVWEL